MSISNAQSSNIKMIKSHDPDRLYKTTKLKSNELCGTFPSEGSITYILSFI